MPPELTARAAEVLELLAKVGGSLALVWGFMARVAKPYIEWRRKKLTDAIRAAVKPELDTMAGLPKTLKQIDVALARQTEVFDEIELFLTVLADTRDQVNDLADLLDASGFASRDRRENPERRRAADDALAELQGRLRRRRRHDHEIENFHYRDT